MIPSTIPVVRAELVKAALTADSWFALGAREVDAVRNASARVGTTTKKHAVKSKTNFGIRQRVICGFLPIGRAELQMKR